MPEKGKIKITRWSVLTMIVVSAALVILYINNVFRVDALLEDMRAYEKKYHFLKNRNKTLAAKVIRLQSAERITEIAEKKLGMVENNSAPGVVKGSK